MNDARKSHPLKANQAVASEPRSHAWVSASAGTGKTQVLTARVLRLLLNGADPSGILCITFTKAGAAEMSERLNRTLADWVRCPDKDLKKHLFNLKENHEGDAVGEARTLFARVLEAPGGLRIETIHAFAQSLLAAFPMESGVAPGFAALDERSTALLKRRVLADVLVDAESNGDPVIDDFRSIALSGGDGRLMQMLGRMTDHAARFETFRSREEIGPRVRHMLEAPSDLRAALVRRCSDENIDVQGLKAFALALGQDKGVTAQTRADQLARWLARSPDGRADHLDELFDGFLKKDRLPLAKMATAGMKKADPGIEGLGERLCEACVALHDLVMRAQLAEWLAVTLRAGWQVARAYTREKERQGVIDYGDMIERAAALLAAEGMGAWVRYKLDQRLDHILIDEAQDTNEAQWTIARKLTEEFFAGQGARDKRRTIFAVGDFKQAIFSFQGTDPREFEAARCWFEEEIKRSGSRLHDLDLAESFRSTEAVLNVVDQIVDMLGPAAFGLERPIPRHVANRRERSQVILLPPVTPASADGEDDGDSDLAGEEDWASDAERLHATRLARRIALWLSDDDPLWLEASGRRLKPEDVLVLVRSRGDFTSMLVARLHEEGVAVAGVDRLRLTAPLAVQDMLSLIRFVLQPDDDLTLATLLVSPLIGLSQDQLFQLAHGRRGSLWRRLRQLSSDDADFAAAESWLQSALAMADFDAPYEFMETVLSGPLEGRRRLLARLGEEARDPVDELLNQALAFEAANLPSLQGFLDWIEREEMDVKRDPSVPRGEVRIMTVHGSKGLEAPLVIIADATRDPDRNSADHAMVALEAGGAALPMYCAAKAARGAVADAFAADAERARQEHWRLGYVALTRAKDILVVAGALGPQARGQVPDGSWYAAARDALNALGAQEQPDQVYDQVQVYHAGEGARPVRRRKPQPLIRPVLPGWVHSLPAPEQVPPRPLAPSSLGTDDVPDPPLPPSAADAARRGTLLHGLFERLPGIAPEHRREIAESWLAKPGREEDAARRALLADAALAVIEDPAFADIFLPDALAEAPVAAVVNDMVVAGTVDRLLVTDSAIRVVDFKTGSRVPRTMDDVPRHHARQMAAYVAALEKVFPDRTVEAALLYTSGPRLIVLDAAMIAAYRPGVAPSIAIGG